MLLASIVARPVRTECPEDFKQQARKILSLVQGTPGQADSDLREALFRFIGVFANLWNNSINQVYLDAARGLVRAAHGDEAPFVVDPFAGGGSIPLEALRVGCDAFASDLNPVAGLILKTMLVDIPKNGRELAEELRRVAAEVQAKAQSLLSDYYPNEVDGSKPLTYLWARTVTCDTCGTEVPMIRSCWLSKRKSKPRALRFKKSEGKPVQLRMEVFEPKSSDEVPAGTVNRAKATCPVCRMSMSPERVRTQLTPQRGGANPVLDDAGHRVGGARLIAVVVEGLDGERDFRGETAERVTRNFTDASNTNRRRSARGCRMRRSIQFAHRPMPEGCQR